MSFIVGHDYPCGGLEGQFQAIWETFLRSQNFLLLCEPTDGGALLGLLQGPSLISWSVPLQERDAVFPYHTVTRAPREQPLGCHFCWKLVLSSNFGQFDKSSEFRQNIIPASHRYIDPRKTFVDKRIQI